jgi:cold shock CspA family protein
MPTFTGTFKGWTHDGFGIITPDSNMMGDVAMHASNLHGAGLSVG